jgi:hypothetical protein
MIQLVKLSKYYCIEMNEQYIISFRNDNEAQKFYDNLSAIIDSTKNKKVAQKLILKHCKETLDTRINGLNLAFQ